MQRIAAFPGLLEQRPGSNSRTNRHHGVVSDFVAAEVNGPFEILDFDEILGKRGYQRQRQIAVRDRLAVRQLTGSSIFIDVYPLEIIRRLGKAIDTILIDDDPVGDTDLDVLKRLRVID